jgi:hypothetical protein
MSVWTDASESGSTIDTSGTILAGVTCTIICGQLTATSTESIITFTSIGGARSLKTEKK